MTICQVDTEYNICRPKYCCHNLSTAYFMEQIKVINNTAQLVPSQILLGISGSNWRYKVSPQPCHELVKLLQNLGCKGLKSQQ